MLRPISAFSALVLCCACTFDPSALTGGSGGGGGIGGDTTDGGVGGGDGSPGALDGGVVPRDATPPDCDPGCPGNCDESGTCHVVCGGGGGGGEGVLPGDGPPPCEAVTCPAGIPCHVHCIGQDACDQPIDCSQSSWCRIDCTDDRTCAAQLTCGAGLCEVRCDGQESCGGGLECQDSCFCDLQCNGESSCGEQAVCPAGCDADPDCKTSGAGCSNSC